MVGRSPAVITPMTINMHIMSTVIDAAKDPHFHGRRCDINVTAAGTDVSHATG
jgi:hypothetical protein